MIFAYADPPYLGHGAADYGHMHPDAADYDNPAAHVALLARLVDEYPDGWAVSLDQPSLRLYLDHCPTDCRIGIYAKSFHQIRVNVAVQYAWEPVIWRGGRKVLKRAPLVRDWTLVSPATSTQRFKGSKPQRFNRWVLDLLGYEEGDEMHDLFPGSHSMAITLANGVLL